MILLDTNVVSEMMRKSPEPRVIKWLDTLQESYIWISSITMAEIRLGIALLPNGKRKTLLFEIAEQMFAEDFANQCLPFDCEAARNYSQIVADRQCQGRPISVEDAQIASIALTGSMTLSTRNIKDFHGIPNLKIINPWKL
jgi:predicted nucleic acid-binding protein